MREANRNARSEPAASDRDHDGARPLRQLLRELEPERALTGDDAGVVERVR